MVWNAAVFTAALTLFGGIQVWNAGRSAEALMDEALVQRAMDILRGPGPGRGPMPNRPMPGGPVAREGNPPPNERQAPPFQPGEGGEPPGDGPAPLRKGPNGNPRSLEMRVGAIARATPFRRPSMIHADGTVMVPAFDQEPWSRELIPASRQGRIALGYAVHQGVAVRVASVPMPRPDGQFDIVQVAQEAEPLRIARQGQIVSLASALPFVLLASILLSLVLSKLVLHPVAELTQVAERLAGDPFASDRIPVSSDDEMGRLSASFNAMTDRMQEANTQLEDALQRQRQFTSDAAHEFRTPLTSIALAAENGLHAEATAEEMQRSLQIVERAATSLSRMTELLLGLSRLDSGQRTLPVVRTKVSAIASEAVQLAGLDQDERLSLEIGADAPEVIANSDALRQILVNMLSNAAGFTPADGSIRVRQEGSTVLVADTGEGIAPEHLDKLFDRFYRADPSRSRERGGHGLGLSISRSLAEAMGATIRVASTLGAGTTFFIDFPAHEISS